MRWGLLLLTAVAGAALIGASHVSATDFAGSEVAAIGDFNQDGRPDLVLAAPLFLEDGTVARALKLESLQPDGSFVETELSRDPSIVNAGHFAAGDFDGDGLNDLAWINVDSGGSSSLYMAKGKAGAKLDTPSLRRTLPAGVNGNGTAAADLTGDGLADLVVTTDGGVDVVAGARTAPLTTAPVPIAGAPAADQVRVVPTPGSGIPQLFLRSLLPATPELPFTQPGPVVRLTKGPGGSWTSSGGLGDPAADFAVGDLDGDGLLDLVTIEQPGGDRMQDRLLVRLGRSAGGFGDPVVLANPVMVDGQIHPMRSVAVGDVDGAERPDVLLALDRPDGSGLQDLILFAGRDDGGFYDAEPVNVNSVIGFTAEFLRLVDLDGRRPDEAVFAGNPTGDRAGAGEVQFSRPNLLVTAQAPPSVERGQTLPLSVTVRNRGSRDATGVTLHVALPPGLAAVAAQTAGDCATASCQLGSIAREATKQVRIVLRAQDTGKMRVTLKVRASQPDLNNDDNDLEIPIEVTPPPPPPSSFDLVVRGGADVHSKTGARLATTFRVTNMGPGVANATRLSVSVDGRRGRIALAGPQACTRVRPSVCSLGSLASGQTRTVSFSGRVTAAGTFAVAASATANGSDRNAGDNLDSVTLFVTKRWPLPTATNGPDRLVGTSAADRLRGLGGNDFIVGGRGNDTLFGGPGRDHLIGGPGRDVLNGGPGADRIGAADGQGDRIRCGRGHDVVVRDRLDIVSRDCERVTMAGRRP